MHMSISPPLFRIHFNPKFVEVPQNNIEKDILEGNLTFLGKSVVFQYNVILIWEEPHRNNKTFYGSPDSVWP